MGWQTEENSLNPDDFCFEPRQVVLWELDRLRASVPPREQLDELKEDLAQINFRGSIVLDVGWYPEFDSSGTFVVVVVRDADWGRPLFDGACASVESLGAVISAAAACARRASSNTLATE